MKKSIQKPENWQDFESLCKKLWGEVWGIPMKIKKNGRNGQPQAGVDVYGVPKGATNYWGIQCKGKDDYTSAKLTTAEIENEIKKAKLFSPRLEVFIFATTMNKDAEVEKFVRIKDLQSRRNGDFEILLFCWEDIADLIDENRDTYNFWVANKHHKTNFNFEVFFNNLRPEITIHPKCIRRIRRYLVRETIVEKENTGLIEIGKLDWMRKLYPPSFVAMTQGRINEAICSFEIIMFNTGSTVIEDWGVGFEVLGEHEKVMDQLGSGPFGMADLSKLRYKRTYVKDNFIYYSPNDNEPLIQKVNRYFEAYIIPKCREYVVDIQWELLARDFDVNGVLHLKVEPEYIDEFTYEYVDSEDLLKDDEIISIQAKKNYTDEANDI